MGIKVIFETDFKDLILLKRGKVRDIYDLGKHLLIISTDRLSAFDVVFNEAIPYKGVVLNKLSEFWFAKTSQILENHFVNSEIVKHYPDLQIYSEELKQRAMLVKKAEIIPFECIVRGYLMGSAYEDYKRRGKVGSVKLMEGLELGSKLKEPIFTPSTKEDLGHDRNISYEEFEEALGSKKASFIKEISIKLFKYASNYSLEKGIIIADTKFEFGEIGGRTILVDEIFTPDSSRFLFKEDYERGVINRSLDKQFVRDYLNRIGWNREPPPPHLSEEVIEETSKRYLEIYNLITGLTL